MTYVKDDFNLYINLKIILLFLLSLYNHGISFLEKDNFLLFPTLNIYEKLCTRVLGGICHTIKH